MMENYVGFLLTALLLVSCMRPSEQTDRPPQRRNDRSNRPAGGDLPPRPTRASRWTGDMNAALMGMYNSATQSHRARSHQLIPQGDRVMSNRRRRPDIIWNNALESQLLDLLRNDPQINRDPHRLHRRWYELHPDLQDIGQMRLYDRALRIENHQANQAGRQHQESEIISTTDSAPGTPNSETGSEIAWDDIHVPLSRLRLERGYESDGTESSSSIPPYPESPRARTPR